MKKLRQADTLILFILVLFVFCNNNEETKIIASVGDKILSEEDLKSMLTVQSLKEVNYRNLIDIVNRWIDNELLYLEALDSGLRKDPEIDKVIKREIEKIERNLLIDKYFDINISSKLEFSNDELQVYYENNKEEFRIDENRYYISHIATPNKESADRLEELISKNINFENILTQDIADCQVFNYKPKYVKLDDIDPQVSRRVTRLKEGETTRKFRVNNVYHFVKLNDIKRTGDYLDFDDVKEEIKLILTFSKRSELKENLISGLRNKNKHQIYFNILRELAKLEEGGSN